MTRSHIFLHFLALVRQAIDWNWKIPSLKVKVGSTKPINIFAGSEKHFT